MNTHRTRSAWRSPRPYIWLFVVIGAVFIVALSCRHTTPETTTVPREQAPPTVTAIAPPGSPADPAAAWTVTVPKLGVTSALMSLGLRPDRTIEAPPLDDVSRIGWYSLGPKPGERGPAILLGHVNRKGVPGVFARLDQLVAGDHVDVTGPGGRQRFTVYHTQKVAKTAFPTSAVYGDTAGPELRLVTCGGDLDASGHNYRDNIIAFARIDQR